jgi:hypothetical protein
MVRLHTLLAPPPKMDTSLSHQQASMTDFSDLTNPHPQLPGK